MQDPFLFVPKIAGPASVQAAAVFGGGVASSAAPLPSLEDQVRTIFPETFLFEMLTLEWVQVWPAD